MINIQTTLLYFKKINLTFLLVGMWIFKIKCVCVSFSPYWVRQAFLKKPTKKLADLFLIFKFEIFDGTGASAKYEMSGDDLFTDGSNYADINTCYINVISS